MSVLPIFIHPDAVLRQVAEPVRDITDEIRTLLHDMADTMYDARGIGLAAPQIGVSKRLVVMDTEQDEESGERHPLFLINPEIIAVGADKTVLDEGCLSLPEMRIDVTRPDRVVFRYTDIDGVQHDVEAADLMAKCIQHEIDHLNGRMIFDYLSPVRRDMVLRRYLKKLKELE